MQKIAEYIVVGFALAALLPLCSFRMLGALQQSGYDGKRFSAWMKKKGNMVGSTLTILAFLTLLSCAVIAVCFAFTGFSAYLSLIPFPVFVAVYCRADRRALKVPLAGTKRAQRIYGLEVFIVLVCSAAFAIGVNAVAFYAKQELVTCLRYLPMSVLPLLLPLFLRLANAIDRPFSERRNRKFVLRAKRKIDVFGGVKIAITGSFGKTSVKNILASILSVKYRVLITPASFNTPLGIARTAEENLPSDYDFFIAEMGARHKGDIAELCEVFKPDHCIVTGICPQHLETFGSVDAIIEAKGEILSGIKEGGFAVIGKDEFTDRFDTSKVNSVAVGERCEVGISDVVAGPQGVKFCLAFGAIKTEVQSKLLGAHSAKNIALAAALAYKLGMTKEEIAEGIARADYIPHRLQPIVSGGVTVLDDSYNSNIVGAADAIEVLSSFGGRKFAVTPGLVELGVLEEAENFALGEKLAVCDRVILVGATLVQCVKRGYLSAGGAEENLTVVPTLASAQEILAKELNEGDCVLFLNDLPDIYN